MKKLWIAIKCFFGFHKKLYSSDKPTDDWGCLYCNKRHMGRDL